MTANPTIPKAGVLRDWVDLYTPHGEAPPEMHLAAALALLSAAVGWRAWIRWGEMTEPCTLNVVLTGTSATARKTTTAYAAKRIADLATASLGDHPPLRVRDITHTSDRGLLELVAPKDTSQADQWERDPPPGHLFIWDEIGAVLGRPGDVKGGDWLGRVRATIMQLTSGRHGGIQLGSTKMPPARCAVSILGTMTRSELEQRMSAGLVNDGFVGRMVLIPYGARTTYLAEPPAWTPIDAQRRDNLILAIRRIITSGVIGEAFQQFTTPAHDLRKTWYQARAKELDLLARDGDDTAQAVVAAFGRLQAIAVKLATLDAISRSDPDDTDLRIDDAAVAWGIWYAEHSLQEVRSLVDTATESTDDKYCRKVTAYLTRMNGTGPIGRKQLLDGVWHQGLSRRQLWSIVEGMHTDGTLTISETRTNGRPGLTVKLTSTPQGNAEETTSAQRETRRH